MAKRSHVEWHGAGLPSGHPFTALRVVCAAGVRRMVWRASLVGGCPRSRLWPRLAQVSSFAAKT
eukprot:scaffold56093_cov42-Prasinocladus_malaysianus.AAC.1